MLKLVFGFLLRLVLVYGVLAVLGFYQGGEWYAQAFRYSGEWIFGSFWEQGVVRFWDAQIPYPQVKYQDTAILIVNQDSLNNETNQDNIPVEWILTSSRDMGYTPIALLIALILATSFSWQRKGWALLWGLVLIQVVIVFKVMILISFLVSDSQLGIITLSPFWYQVLSANYVIFVENFTVSYIIPILIWILVLFRRRDWEQLNQSSGNQSIAI